MNFFEKANVPEELLYLVDEKDQVLGSIKRNLANQDPKKIHREVGILIFDNENRLLLQKRSRYKSVHPGVWSITAGHIQYQSEALATANEELWEELGFRTNLLYLEKKLHRYPHESHFMYYFLAYYQQQKLRLSQSEVEKIDFFSLKTYQHLCGQEKVNIYHNLVYLPFWQGKYQEQISTLINMARKND